MRQFMSWNRLTRKGDGAGDLGRRSDGGVIVGHFGGDAICILAARD